MPHPVRFSSQKYGIHIGKIFGCGLGPTARSPYKYNPGGTVLYMTFTVIAKSDLRKWGRQQYKIMVWMTIYKGLLRIITRIMVFHFDQSAV